MEEKKQHMQTTKVEKQINRMKDNTIFKSPMNIM